MVAPPSPHEAPPKPPWRARGPPQRPTARALREGAIGRPKALASLGAAPTLGSAP